MSTEPGGTATGEIVLKYCRPIGGIRCIDHLCLYSYSWMFANFISPAGGDYTPVNTELTFSSTNADVPQNVTIFILDDLLLEDSEYFNVTLTRASSSAILTDSFTVIIEDEDSKLNCCYGCFVCITACTQQNVHGKLLIIFRDYNLAQHNFIFFS